ncbi:MAG: LPS assembly lipoprotein LptE [Chitinophagaceae bacterium]
MNRTQSIFTKKNKFYYFFSTLNSFCLGKRIQVFYFIVLITFFSSCGVYSFKDVSIDYSKIKTIKIGFFENKARYVNPQLSVKLTDKVQQKIISQTKLTRTNNDDAHLQLSGYISNYDPSQTVGISNQQTTTNRLTVTVHITVRNTVENTNQEYDISRNFDFDANLSLQQAEAQLLDKDVIPSITDEIFNKIFSNW